MEQNPFDLLEQKLDRIATLLERAIENSLANKVSSNEDLIGDILLAEDITKLKRATIYSHVHLHTIPHIKKGGKLYFSKHALLRWIKGEIDEENIVQRPSLFPRQRRFHNTLNHKL